MNSFFFKGSYGELLFVCGLLFAFHGEILFFFGEGSKEKQTFLFMSEKQLKKNLKQYQFSIFNFSFLLKNKKQIHSDHTQLKKTKNITSCLAARVRDITSILSFKS